MPKAREVREAFEQELALESTVLETVRQTLGDAEEVSRGPGRGVTAVEWNALDIARYTLGVLAAFTTRARATRVDEDVAALRTLHRTEPLRFSRSRAGAWDDALALGKDPSVELIPAGSLDGALAHVLDGMADPRRAALYRNAIKSFAIVWERDFALARFAVGPGTIQRGRPSEAAVDVYFAADPEHVREALLRPAGLRRTAEVDGTALVRIAGLLGPEHAEMTRNGDAAPVGPGAASEADPCAPTRGYEPSRPQVSRGATPWQPSALRPPRRSSPDEVNDDRLHSPGRCGA